MTTRVNRAGYPRDPFEGSRWLPTVGRHATLPASDQDHSREVASGSAPTGSFAMTSVDFGATCPVCVND